MKARLWLAFVFIAAPLLTHSQGALDLTPTDLGTIQVQSANVGIIDTSHLEIVVKLSVLPTQSGTLKNVQLCSLHMNGLPVFALPLEQEIVLKKGEKVQLPPLTVSVYYHDIYTARPLEDMLEKETVRVEGELVSDLQVGFLAKLVLHSQHPRIVVPIKQDVPVAIGVSALQRRLAIGVLSTLDTQMSSDTASNILDRLRPGWIQEIEKTAAKALVVVQSSYSVEKDKTRYAVNSEALGFRVPSGSVVTAAEMLSPWKYDSDFLGALNEGQAKFVKNSQDIRVGALAGVPQSMSLLAADFSTQERGIAQEQKLTRIGKSREQIHLLARSSPSSFALLVPASTATALKSANPASALASAPAAVLAQSSWDKLLVFRLRAKSAGSERTVEPLELGAKRDENSIRLNRPVDASVFGSPILVPEGVIGIVQDEWTGTLLPADLNQPAQQSAQR